MAGYSSTPQARKLGPTPGLRVALDHVPPDWQLVDPPDVEVVTAPGPADLIACFVRAAAELDERIVDLGRRTFPDGARKDLEVISERLSKTSLAVRRTDESG